EAEHLLVHSVLLEHCLAIGDVAMAAHGDVVVARIVKDRIAFTVDRHLHPARSGAQRIEVSLRVEVIVKVDDHCRVPSAECRVPSAEYRVPSTECRVPSAEYQRLS